MTTSTFHAKSTALEFVKGLNVNLHGKLVLITGGTPGIGIETARALEHISKTTTNNDKIEVMKLDLNSPQSVGDFVDQFRARHLPINILISGKPSRVVVVVSSFANKRGGINWENIMINALLMVRVNQKIFFFAKQFNKLYSSESIQAYALHLGGIMTNLNKYLSMEEQKAMGWFKEYGTPVDRFKNVEQGASTSVYTALAPELDNEMEPAERLWKLSEQMAAVK
ncbi:unnamed protein product [Rotaria sp. Silwood2]|nr:unnamed protein product [Rotaria sp. Silwood2]